MEGQRTGTGEVSAATSGPEEASGRSSRWRRWLTLPVLVLLVALSVRLVAGIGWHEVLVRLAAASKPLVAAAFLLKLGQVLIWSGRWRLAVSRLADLEGRPRTGLTLLFAAQVSGIAANILAPFVRVLGGLVRARYLSAFSAVPIARGYGTVLFDQLAHSVSNILLTLFALVAGADLTGRPRLALALGLAAAALLAGLAGWAYWRSVSLGDAFRTLFVRRGRKRKNRNALLAAGGEVMDVVSKLLAAPGLWGRSVGLGVVLFLAAAAAQWVVFQALGMSVGFFPVSVVVSLGAAAGLLTGTPGGVGGTEAAMISLYSALGIDPVGAAAGTLLFRSLHYGLVLGVGLPALLGMELRLALRRTKGAP